MDNLEFENFDMNEGEGTSSDSRANPRPSKDKEDLAIDFSNKVIGALEDKIKLNSASSKINITQLKKVYTHGATTPQEDKGLYAMARVNMYMRMKNEKQITLGKEENAPKEKLTELVLENSVPIRIDKYIDVTENWIPLETDFAIAKEDIIKYELNYKFNHVNDLYLSEYEKIEIEY